MSERFWEPTKKDLAIDRDAVYMQAEARGLDLANPYMLDLLNHVALVISTLHAENRFIRGALHGQAGKPTGNG